MRIQIPCILLLAIAVSLNAEPYNHGKAWRAMSKEARLAYLDGLSVGRSQGFMRTYMFFGGCCAERLATEQFAQLRDEMRSNFRSVTVEPVVTELYADPANAFIWFDSAADLAADRLRGKDIDDAILAARRRALETHEATSKVDR